MAKKVANSSKPRPTVAVTKPKPTATAPKVVTASVKVPVPVKKSKYIDPLTDFGFKRIFGNKVLLINFLNGVLNHTDGIADLTYAPTIRTGIAKDDRTAIFDLYCTTATGIHIVVEMQLCWHKNYKQRTIHYLSRLIQEQAQRGKDWDYSTPPIFLINIVDFEIDKELKKEDFLSRVKFMYEKINMPYYDDATIVYLELPLFTKKVKELETNIDHWMYALKFMPQINRLPKALQQGIFQKLFEQAKIAKMTKKQQNAYYKSVEDMSIIKNTVNFLTSTVDDLTSTVAEQAKELEEYRRRYGSLSGTSQTPRHTSTSAQRKRR